ncbi:MAG: hypothetical protein JSU08_13195 [Acidobacteria bacterium]|nr:hypothetical protein [Acidobacteriota bacterium]
MKKSMALTAAAVLTAMAGTTALQAAGQKFQEAIIVRGKSTTMAQGDMALTFSAPVSLPGLSLSAGTYVFQDGGSNAILVRDSTGKPYRWLLTLPTVRQTATDNYSILFDRETEPNAPPRIVAIFAPGESHGREFIYPKR